MKTKNYTDITKYKESLDILLGLWNDLKLKENEYIDMDNLTKYEYSLKNTSGKSYEKAVNESEKAYHLSVIAYNKHLKHTRTLKPLGTLKPILEGGGK